jgi:hypothetical protein
MPAAAIIPILAEVIFPEAAAAAGGIAGALGSTVLGGAIAADTIVAEAVGGAIIGAGEGALSAVASGKDPLKGAELGAISGGVGSAVGNIVGPALTAQNALGSSGPGGALARGITKTVSGLAGNTAAGVAAGEPLSVAARGALPGALAGGLATGLVSGFGYDGGSPKGIGELATAGLQYGLTGPLQRALGTPSQTVNYTTGSQGASQSQSPVSQAESPLVQTAPNLGSSSAGLSTSPGFAYAPTSPVFGSSDKENKAPSDVWNVSSLRELGSAVT